MRTTLCAPLPTGMTRTVYQAGHGPDILLLHGTTFGDMQPGCWSLYPV